MHGLEAIRYRGTNQPINERKCICLDQRGPIESELNEYGRKGRVLAPVIGRYGGACSG